ncbi:MAG: Glu-tRNA(Gln) amidotransferase subunit GatE [Candidatus Woesearchaeota archaeon]
MTEQSINYEELGFKAGLEIHQQLEGKKLFCNCKTVIRKDKPHFSFKRQLRASAGESGQVDKAALHELEKSKEFEYLAYHDTTCLVETDDEPPHEVNKAAIIEALKLAKLLNMKVVDCIQFMRKTVIDGSNTSGFQRTALIAKNGYIEVENKKIRIESLCLEEESAQVIKRTKTKDTYNISRLGIPLLEIATAPDIKSPEECKLVAKKLGMFLRSIDVKRGLGSIRQDVNVSIKGGARTEVKGFQDYRNIPKVIDFEIKRQLSLIKQKKKVESGVRKAEADFSTTYLRPMPGADRMYPETDVEVIIPNFKVKIPETLEEQIKRYQKEYSLSKDQATLAVKNNDDFEELFKKYKKLDAGIIVDVLLMKAKDVERKEGLLKHLVVDELLSNLEKQKISISSVPDILVESTKKKIDYSKYEALDDNEVEKIVKKVISENKGAPMGALMGKAMSALKGKADGKKVAMLVNKLK